ncbi:MAG TPA: HNH endonuclease, partial [Acidobacteriota bacterium]|nr:HNH endonuclease [Acidobacteriota bacterium]
KLLDAAHIIGDKEPEGLPVVSNGLALCKLHHAAFDGDFFGIRPDLVIEVKKKVREEKDGPMLLHGLQGLHQTKIIVPKSKKLAPDPDLLEMRFERFRQAG